MARILTVLLSVCVMCVCLAGPVNLTRFLSKRQASIQVADYIQEFGLDLSSELDTNGNLVLSPLSIVVLLSSLMLGTVGTANHQIQEALYLPPGVIETRVHAHFKELLDALTNTHPQVIVNVANGLFLQQNIHIQNTYSSQAKQYYGTQIQTVNFRSPTTATSRINAWIKDKTQGLIPKLLTSPLVPQTMFFAANTVFFNGTWETIFDSLDTREEEFYTSTGPILVPMMNSVMPVSYIDIPSLNAHMISLPYKGGQLAMYILMSKNSQADLRTLEYSLEASTIDFLVRNMSQHVNMAVSLPRMRLTYRTSLTSALKSLGVTDIFSPQRANFHRLTVRNPVWVEEVVHEAVIEITERGTTAAAATGAILDRIAINREFKVNRPAIFFIRDTSTGIPLFWGRVMRPDPLPKSG